MRRKEVAAVLMAGLVACLSVTGCGQTAQEENVQVVEEEFSILVDGMYPEKGDLILQNRFVGAVSPQEQVAVIPLVSGEVTVTNFEVGDIVQAGDVLFKIDDSAAQMQLSAAQLGVENAQMAQRQAELGVQSAQQAANSTLGTQEVLAQLNRESNVDALEQQIDSTYASFTTAADGLSDLYDKLNDVQKMLDHTYASIDSYKSQIAEKKKEIEAASTVSSNSVSTNVTTLQGDIKALEAQITAAYATASGYETQKTSIKNTIESTETSLANTQKSIDHQKKSLETVKQSNEIQANQMYEETRQSMATNIQNAQLGVETAGVGIASAEANVSSAQLQLSYYTVTAPISGVIDSKSVNVHNMAATGNVAYTISNKDTMTVTFQVSEAIKNTLSVGDVVTVERNGVEYDAVITEIGVALNQQTGLFAIKATAAANGNELPNGVSVTVTADTYSALNSLMVPYESIYYEDGKAYLYVVKDNRAVKTYVETGIFNDDNITITGGITAEDYCITSWSPQLADGVLVKTTDETGTKQETTDTKAADSVEENSENEAAGSVEENSENEAAEPVEENSENEAADSVEENSETKAAE